MMVSNKMKDRFCKDCKVPIRLFPEPYFESRLELFDSLYDSKSKWELFVDCLSKFESEQEYYTHYNSVKDEAINHIKNSDGYIAFNSDDMNKYAIKNVGYPNKGIFKPSLSGHLFISIDMKHANFSSLNHYAKDIFYWKETWEEFLKMFTSCEHIIRSKYIRQVIMGNCNPRRQVTYEKYLMDQFFTNMLDFEWWAPNVVYFSNDEIVIDLTQFGEDSAVAIESEIKDRVTRYSPVPMKTEVFKIKELSGIEGYIKFPVGNKFDDAGAKRKVEFKSVNPIFLPFILRQYNGEPIKEVDKIFEHEGMLASFIEILEITF